MQLINGEKKNPMSFILKDAYANTSSHQFYKADDIIFILMMR